MVESTNINAEINLLIGKLTERLSVVLSDPLREQTRKSRKNLLVLCAILTAVAYGNVIPKEIAALGVKLDAPSQTNLLISGGAIVSFILLSFLICAASDFQRAMVDFRAYQGDYKTLKSQAADWYKEQLASRKRSWDLTIRARLAWEFLAPIGVYLVTMYCLVAATLGL